MKTKDQKDQKQHQPLTNERHPELGGGLPGMHGRDPRQGPKEQQNHLRTRRQMSGPTGTDPLDLSTEGISIESAAPPLLIGGVLQHLPNRDQQVTEQITLTGAGYDWLSLTIPNQTVPVMMEMTGSHEVGGMTKGFKQSEQRMCMGGYCWRKFNPYTPSKRWGLGYESWEFAGVTAIDPIKKFMGLECRPSRVDIAFDFSVPDEVMPSIVESLVAERCKETGTTISHHGPNDSYSIYIGAHDSEKIINVYRWDLKHDPMHQCSGPRLRVELRLRGLHAESWWNDCVKNHHDGIRTAAAICADIMGYRVVEDTGELPEIIRRSPIDDAAQMVFQFIKQNHSMLDACSQIGIDLGKLARQYVDQKDCKMSASRMRRRMELLTSQPPERITEEAQILLRVPRR